MKFKGVLVSGAVGLVLLASGGTLGLAKGFNFKSMYYQYNKNASVSKVLEDKIRKYDNAMLAATMIYGGSKYKFNNKTQYINSLGNLKEDLGIKDKSSSQVYKFLVGDKKYKQTENNINQYMKENSAVNPKYNTHVKVNLTKPEMLSVSDTTFKYYYDDKTDTETVVLNQTASFGNSEGLNSNTVFRFDSTGTPLAPSYIPSK